MRKHLQLQILCFTFATAEGLEKKTPKIKLLHHLLNTFKYAR